MITTVFDSGGVPETDRLELFNETLRCEHTMAVTADPSGFSAKTRVLELPSLKLMEMTCSEASFRRTPKMIREADPEAYSVAFPLRGRMLVGQGERTAEIRDHELALYSSSYPTFGTLGPSTSIVHAFMPRKLLRLPERRVDHLTAKPMSVRSGVGAVFAAFMTQLTSDTATYSPADMSRLSSVAVDLLAAVLAHHLDTDPSESARQTALLPQVKAFIQGNLGDPDLSPGSVAAAHHISVSYLHRLFQDQEMTVAAWIRRQRLDRAGRDLADTGLRDLSIHRIASRWGFADHATFTRAFRAAYGVPPREYRQRELARRERENALLAS